MCTKNHQSVALANIMPPVTAKQRVVIIFGDQPEEGIDGCGAKDFEKRKVLRRTWETQEKGRQAVLGSEYDNGEELDDDDG